MEFEFDFGEALTNGSGGNAKPAPITWLRWTPPHEAKHYLEEKLAAVPRSSASRTSSWPPMSPTARPTTQASGCSRPPLVADGNRSSADPRRRRLLGRRQLVAVGRMAGVGSREEGGASGPRSEEGACGSPPLSATSRLVGRGTGLGAGGERASKEEDNAGLEG